MADAAECLMRVLYSSMLYFNKKKHFVLHGRLVKLRLWKLQYVYRELDGLFFICLVVMSRTLCSRPFMLSIAVNFLSHMLGYAVVHLRLYVFLRVLCVIFFIFIQLVHCSPLTSDDFHQRMCSITSIFYCRLPTNRSIL